MNFTKHLSDKIVARHKEYYYKMNTLYGRKSAELLGVGYSTGAADTMNELLPLIEKLSNELADKKEKSE